LLVGEVSPHRDEKKEGETNYFSKGDTKKRDEGGGTRRGGNIFWVTRKSAPLKMENLVFGRDETAQEELEGKTYTR